MLNDSVPKPEWTNLFDEDPWGEPFWIYLLGKDHFSDLKPRFVEMGRRAALATPFSQRADVKSPELLNFNERGERVDEIRYHPDFHQLQEMAYGAGIVGMKYDTEFLSRHREVRHRAGFGIGYYFAQTEMSLYCPVCMTDGVARVLERHGRSAIAKETIQHLASPDLSTLWQGAMFLTEIQGGSDVGANAAQSRQEGEKWFVSGEKWFCSNVDAKAILLLARMPGSSPADGTKGLGLFLALRDVPMGNHQKIRIDRIKSKMGVRSMPTGEVRLEDLECHLIGGEGQGFKLMAEMLNMSRLYNSVAAVAAMRRSLMEALAYGRGRKAFGERLLDLPLWRASMADLVAEHLAAQHLVFDLTRRLDEADGGDRRAEYLVRLLTPVAKAITGKLAVFTASESMEAIGGNAYIEDHILPRILRDAQVLPIWEGTTNILSLDALRVLKKFGADGFYSELQSLISGGPSDLVKPLKARFETEGSDCEMMLKGSDLELASRAWIEGAARSYSQALLVKSMGDKDLARISRSALQRTLRRAWATSPLGVSGGREDEAVLLEAEG